MAALDLDEARQVIARMGERFGVMGFEKDVEFGAAFLAGDLSFRL